MKRVLFAKLHSGCLIVQEDCLALIEEILSRHKLEHLTFISILGKKSCDLSLLCLSALDYFGCLEIDQEALDEEDEHGIGQRNTQGIFLLPSYRYSTSYAKDTEGFYGSPVNVGVFGLVINASRSSVKEYVLMMNYVMLICSHTVFLHSPKTVLLKPASGTAYLERFLVTDCKTTKMLSVIDYAKYQQPVDMQIDGPVEDAETIACGKDNTPERIRAIMYPVRGETADNIARIFLERNEEMMSLSATESQYVLSQIRTSTLASCNEAYQSAILLSGVSGFLEEVAEELQMRRDVRWEFDTILEVRLHCQTEFTSKSDHDFTTKCDRFYRRTAGKLCFATRNPDLVNAVSKVFEPEQLEYEDTLFVDTWPHRVFVQEVETKLDKIEKEFKHLKTCESLNSFIAHFPHMYGSGIEDLDYDTHQGIDIDYSPTGTIWNFSAAYDFLLQGFDPPSDSAQVFTCRMQYGLGKRLYDHHRSIKSAAHELRAVYSSLQEDFIRNLLYPDDYLVPLPNFQDIFETTLPEPQWQSMKTALRQRVSDRFIEMRNAFEKSQEYILRELFLDRFGERRIREESAIIFQTELQSPA